MPKNAKELKPLQVRTLSKGTHRVGGCIGLCLSVVSDTNKHWTLRARIGGKDHEIGLGSYPTVTLEEARRLGRECQEQIKKGLNPIDERRKKHEVLRRNQSKNITFQDAFYAFYPIKKSELSNPKHAAQWESTMQQYVFPLIGSRLLNSLGVDDIVECLRHQNLWTEKTETASRIRQRISSVFDWAISKKLYDKFNPAVWKGILQYQLPDPAKLKKNANNGKLKREPMVPLMRIREFYSELNHRKGMAAKALTLMTLTGCRSGQARFAKWHEFDLVQEVWTIRQGREQAKLKTRDHHVALTSSALKLLKALPKGDENDWVFPNERNRPLSDTAVAKVMKTVHKNAKQPFLCPSERREAVPHGLRSTLTTWFGEKGIEAELLKFQLSHNMPDTIFKHYLRADLVERRREVLQSWDDFLIGLQNE